MRGNWQSWQNPRVHLCSSELFPQEVSATRQWGWRLEGGSDGSREGGQSLSGDTGRGKASLPVAWACQGVWAACSQPPTLSMQEEQSPCVWAA